MMILGNWMPLQQVYPLQKKHPSHQRGKLLISLTGALREEQNLSADR